MATIRTKTKTGMFVFFLIWLPLMYMFFTSGASPSSLGLIFSQVGIFLVAYIPAYIIDYLRFKSKIKKMINYNNLNDNEKKVMDELISNKFDE